MAAAFGQASAPEGVAAKSLKPISSVAGPFVIEELVGDPESNESPTIDYLVGADGAARAVAVALQQLDGGIPVSRGNRRRSIHGAARALCAPRAARG